MKHKFLIAIFCIGLLGLYFACEKDDTFIKEESVVDTSATQITPTLNTLSYDNAGDTFNRLKSELQIGPYFQFEQNDDVLSRSAQDTLGITIFTDVIKEVISGDYASYTMLIITPNTTASKFYNLTIENKNGEASMFITQYQPTENWINNKEQPFEGDVASRSIESLEQAPEPFVEVVEESYSPIDTSGSFDPDACEGTLIIVGTEAVPYPCACGDWTLDECEGCPDYPHFPGTNYEFVYACVPHYTGNPYDGNENPDNGNTNTGGGTTNTNTDSNEGSIAGTVTDDENPCEPPYLVWDINQNCTPDSDLERCYMKNGTGSPICVCVAGGQSEEDCTILNCVSGADLQGINDDDKARISSYILLNGCSDATSEFVERAIEALNNDGVDDGEVDFDEQIIKDASLPDCLKNIIDNLIADEEYLDLGDMDTSVLEQLNLAGHIMNIFNNSDNYYLTFKMDNLGTDINGNPKNAETNPSASSSVPGNFDIVITLDTDYVSNATDLALARTIIHESLHAYLTYITQEDFISTMAIRLVSLSLSLGNDPNQAQHIEMSNNFVDAIALALENWHNSPLTNNEYYQYLSWSGSMLTTDAFLELSSTFQTNCINANFAEGSASNISTSTAKGVNDSNCP